MKKLLFLSLALCAVLPVAAAEDDAAFAFYKMQAQMLPEKLSAQEKQLARTLGDNLGTWTLQYAAHENVPQALLLQTQLYIRAGVPGAAVVPLFKLQKMFAPKRIPDGVLDDAVAGLARDAQDTARRLFASKERMSAGEDPEAREADALYALSLLSGRDFYAPAAAAFESFFVRFPEYKEKDKVELWYGDLHRANRNFLAAIAQCHKVYQLYPDTPYRAASMRLIGDIYADMKDSAKAMNAYDQVLRDFPKSSERGIVYKHMGMLEENNKQYDTALVDYDQAIKLLGTAPAAYEAYYGKADIYLKTKNYAEAYTALHKTADTFRQNEYRYVTPLIHAANVAKKYLKDEAKQIQSLEKALLPYPKGARSAEIMYDLGAAYERQGQTAKAADLYRRLILANPTDKMASKAQTRLSRLEK